MDSDPAIASQKLQTDLLAIQNWVKKWRMKANRSKSTHVTFTTRRENNVQLPKKKVSSIFSYTLTGDFNWHKHIFAKQKQLGIALTKMYWLLRRKSKLSTATNFSHIKQHSNQSGLTEYNSGVRLPLPT
jgi:hypothetical protein